MAEAAAPHGLTAPHGSAGTVGVLEYLLLGGIGSAARATGIGANSVMAVEYVEAAGDLRRADDAADPDRFWALRGGGAAGIGAVTAIEVRLRPGEQVLTGARFWDVEDAADLLRVWRDRCGDTPCSVTTSARVLRLPPMPGVPGPLARGPVVAVDGVASPEGAGAAWDLLDALGAAASPCSTRGTPAGGLLDRVPEPFLFNSAAIALGARPPSVTCARCGPPRGRADRPLHPHVADRPGRRSHRRAGCDLHRLAAVRAEAGPDGVFAR